MNPALTMEQQSPHQPVPGNQTLERPVHRGWDEAEKLVVLVLYAGLLVRIVRSSLETGQWPNLLLLVSEGLVVAFFLVRRPARELSTRWGDWGVAFGATLLPMLVVPGTGPGLLPLSLGAVLLLMGMVVQVHAKLTLGRSVGCVPADRGLQLSGPYRFVRHPMYAGYLVSQTAFLLMNPTLWNAVLFVLCLGLQIPRLLAEEKLLARRPEYRDYTQQVRYRLFPGIF